jgi:hypothetical protein
MLPQNFFGKHKNGFPSQPPDDKILNKLDSALFPESFNVNLNFSGPVVDPHPILRLSLL